MNGCDFFNDMEDIPLVIRNIKIEDSQSVKLNIQLMPDDIKDLRIDLFNQEFKLVSTKSKLVRKIEKTFDEFEKNHFDQWLSTYSDIEVFKRDIIKITEDVITTYKTEYPDMYLIITTKKQYLKHTLIQRFVNYYTLHHLMKVQEKENLEARLNDIFVIDYMLRLQQIINIHWLNEPFINFVTILREYNKSVMFDNRDHYGSDDISEAQHHFYVFFKKNNDLIEKVKQDTSILIGNDNYKELWSKLFNAIELTKRTIEEKLDMFKKIQSRNTSSDKFRYFANKALDLHNEILSCFKDYYNKTSAIKDQAMQLKYQQDFVMKFREYVCKLNTYILEVALDTRKIPEHQQLILNAQFESIKYHYLHREDSPMWIEEALNDTRQHIGYLNQMLNK